MRGHRDTSETLEADQRRQILERQWLELQTLGLFVAHGESFDDLIYEWAQRLTVAELTGARDNN